METRYIYRGKTRREVVNLPLHPRADEKTAKGTVDFITRFTKVI